RRTVNQLYDMIEETQRLAETTARAQDTRHTALMPGEYMEIYDADGNVSAYFSGSNDSGNLFEYEDGPEPNKPSTPELDSAMPGVITVSADGQDEHGEPAESNHGRVIIHLSHEEDFQVHEGTGLRGFTGPEGEVDVSVEPGEWYVALQWETLTGQLSEPSEQAFIEVERLVDSEDIQEALNEAQERLNEAKEEFEEGNALREQEIKNLNEVVLPALRESLDSKADQSALKELDDKLDNLEFPDLPGGIPTKEEVEAAAKAAEAAAKEHADLVAAGAKSEAVAEAEAKAQAAKEAAEQA